MNEVTFLKEALLDILNQLGNKQTKKLEMKLLVAGAIYDAPYGTIVQNYVFRTRAR